MDSRLAYHGGKGIASAKSSIELFLFLFFYYKCASIRHKSGGPLLIWMIGRLKNIKKERKEAYAGRGEESESANPLRYGKKKHSGSQVINKQTKIKKNKIFPMELRLLRILDCDRNQLDI